MKKHLPFYRIRSYRVVIKNLLLLLMIHNVSAFFTLTVNATGIYSKTVIDASDGFPAVEMAQVRAYFDREPPVIECPPAITVECASEIPDPVLPKATDNCGVAKVEWIGDVRSDEICESRFIITRTYRATDINGLTSECSQIITVYDDISPVLKPGVTFPVGQIGMDLCMASIPSGPSPDEIKALFTDNCDGDIVVYKSGEPSGDDCSWSVTYTYIVKDMCRNYVQDVPKVTYSGGDRTPPVLKPGAAFPAGEANMNLCVASVPPGPSVDEIKALYVDNSGGDVIVTDLGSSVTGDDSDWSVTYTYSIKDACNNEVKPEPAIIYTGSDQTPPEIIPVAGKTEYSTEACDPDFRLPVPQVTDNCSGQVIVKVYLDNIEIDPESYEFEFYGVTIVTIMATDASGNTSTLTITVDRTQCLDLSHCTYTQDWYGSPGGTNCIDINGTYQKLDPLSMMTEAFGTLSSVVFGDKSADKYFELMKESISGSTGYEGIFQMLPGGGSAGALLGPATSLDEIGRTAGRWPNVPRSTELTNRGIIMNSLLCRTMALFFNLQNDKSLGEFTLTGRYMVTAKSAECGSEIVVPNSSTYVEIPQSVLDYFRAHNLAGSVDDLYALANNVLAGIETSVPASDVEKAVYAINKGFEECRVLVEFMSAVPSVPKAASIIQTYNPAGSTLNELSEVTLMVYPNPFRQVAKFEIGVMKDSHVRIEIFTHAGVLLDVILNEDLHEGDSRMVEFDGSRFPHTSFLYRVTTSRTMINGTIMKTR
jgi:hypothetical protein